MTLRIALAGTGFIANIHARAIRSQPGCLPAAVVTARADGAADFRAQHDIPAPYPTLDALLASEKIDALVICTPNALHAPQAIAALQAGVPVMVEKPMALNRLEAEAMQEAAQSSGALRMVAHCWRFDAETIWLRDHIQAGKLGEIVRTTGSGVHTHWGPSGWFVDPALAGGGALVDMGIHAIDTARFLLGDPQPASVYARLGTHYIQEPVDDTGILVITWASGASSYIETGWWQPHAEGPESATQVYGRLGFGSLFPTRLAYHSEVGQKMVQVDPGFTHPRPDHASQEMYDQQMAYFIDCIRENRAPRPGGQEGWTNMRIIDAAYESSRSGLVISL